MAQSRIHLSHCSIYTLFDILYTVVGESGGDGSGAIVCDNPHEIAEEYEKWVKRFPEHNKHYLPYMKQVEDDSVNFHDSNENHIFTNDKDIRLFDDDFVITFDNLIVKHAN